MATLERGRGKRRHSVGIEQRGSLLRVQETEAGDARLPGYRRCADPSAARAALEAEVRARLEAGMQPADDEARQIAARQPGKREPALPLRADLGIYNEATGFVVSSRRMAGRALEEGSAAWRQAVARGEILPMTLVQDDSFVLRIVAGEPLSEQEAQEWLARVDAHLDVPDGRLCATGGAVFSHEDYDADDSYWEPFVGEVAIPPGRYRAALYTHAHGVNGSALLDHLAGGYGRGESLENWFARTRSAGPSRGEDEIERVDFLLHLEPIGEPPKTGLSPLPEDGWFDGTENARKPELCPLGLVARDVVRTQQEAGGGWTYVRHVFEALPAIERAEVAGGDVPLPLDSIARAFRIAWFGSRLTLVELRITPPAGVAFELRSGLPDGVFAFDEDGVWRVLFDSDLDPASVFACLERIGPLLREFPDGASLELCCAPAQVFPGAPENAGLVWLGGPIRASEWRISRAHPATDAETLAAALSLAQEIGGSALAVRNEREGEQILAWARRCFGPHLKANPPRLRDGAIRFREPGHEVALVGIAAFAIRFGGTWPFVEIPAHDEN